MDSHICKCTASYEVHKQYEIIQSCITINCNWNDNIFVSTIHYLIDCLVQSESTHFIMNLYILYEPTDLQVQ